MTSSTQKTRQSGTASIEFALIFTLVFAVFWSLVCYAVPLIILQVMNRATAEGGRAAALVLTGVNSYASVSAYQAAAILEATAEATRQVQSITYLAKNMALTPTAVFESDNSICPLNAPAVGGYKACILKVELRIDNYSTVAPIKPLLNLPGIGSIPSLPTNLVATSRVALF